MLAVRACAVTDVEALHALVLQIDEMKASLGGMQAEIGNADNVLFPEHIAHPRQLLARDGE